MAQFFHPTIVTEDIEDIDWLSFHAYYFQHYKTKEATELYCKYIQSSSAFTSVVNLGI